MRPTDRQAVTRGAPFGLSDPKVTGPGSSVVAVIPAVSPLGRGSSTVEPADRLHSLHEGKRRSSPQRDEGGPLSNPYEAR
jgi:hypothetical protein